MPLLKRIRTIAAAIETVIGTAETLAVGDGAMNAYDITIQGNITVEEREGQGTFGHLPGVAGARQGTMSFKTDISIGSGQPLWASVLLPACGWVESATVYTPRDEAPGTNVKTVTLGCYEDGLLKSLAGATGNFKINCPAGKMAFIEWEFQGVWQAPTDTAILAPTYPTDSPIRYASASTSYNAIVLQVENVTVDAGNEVVFREDPTTAGGYVSTLITDRYPMISASPEAVVEATRPDFGDWLGATEAAFAFTLAGPSSSTLAVSAPKAQIMNVQEGDRNKIQTNDIEWKCNKNAAANEQELSITITPEV